MKGSKVLKALSIRLPLSVHEKAKESIEMGLSKSIADYTVRRLFLCDHLEEENKSLKEENKLLEKEVKDIQKRNNELQKSIINALNKVTK